MAKYVEYKVFADGRDVEETYPTWKEAWHRYGLLPNRDKMIAGIDPNGKEHPITWTGKCRVR